MLLVSLLTSFALLFVPGRPCWVVLGSDVFIAVLPKAVTLPILFGRVRFQVAIFTNAGGIGMMQNELLKFLGIFANLCNMAFMPAVAMDGGVPSGEIGFGPSCGFVGRSVSRKRRGDSVLGIGTISTHDIAMMKYGDDGSNSAIGIVMTKHGDNCKNSVHGTVFLGHDTAGTTCGDVGLDSANGTVETKYCDNSMVSGHSTVTAMHGSDNTNSKHGIVRVKFGEFLPECCACLFA
jgi:hypothetical protein